MKKRRVVVTGMGVVSCFGNDVDLFYQRLLAGDSGISMIDTFPCEEFPTRFAGMIRDFDAGEYLDKKQARRVDPYIRYSIVAGKKALERAGFLLDQLDSLKKERCGILIGSGMGGMTMFYDGVQTLKEGGYRRLSPFFVPYIITNMASGMLAIDLGFQGPNYSISTACATGNHSIIAAARHIQQGEADLMLCGGAEAPMSPIGLAGFVQCKALSERNNAPQEASRPWDKERDGFVMGEGAGVIVLEELDHALARGAPIIAEYLGGAFNCDAYHITGLKEDGSGISMCVRTALQDASVAKEQVNYINAHATATPAGDMVEIRAVHSVFGDHVKNIKINATKSLIGHCLGAAGGVETIAVLKAIETGKLHPTRNLENPEEGLGNLDPVAKVAKDHQVEVAINNAFGFGGHNACSVFAPFKG